MNAIRIHTDPCLRHIELVRRAQAGDREAFGELFVQFRPVVFAIVQRRVKDSGEAEELTQDVFVRALQKLGQLRQPEAFPGWIKSIAVRLSLNYLQRKRLPLMDRSAEGGAEDSEQTSPVEQTLACERRDRLHAGLRRLRLMDRQALEAFYVSGKSILQMADEFAAPVGTIKRRLHVARLRLADEVEELASA